MTFRPMLATDADLDKLRYSLLASPKLDGIRAVVRDGVVYSRSNKPIPNKYVQSLFSQYEHYDGELIVGEPTAHDVYRQTTSGVMSADGEPDVRFFVFDHVSSISSPYRHRVTKLSTAKHLVLHEQREIFDLEQLLAYEQDCLDEGYEGLILRDPSAPYKMGRSTAREGYLLKLKRMKTDEATIVGFIEREHNGNVAAINELGQTKRSSHKANKSGRGDLGALVCRLGDVEFNIGTGFTDTERADIWADKDKYLGKLVSFNHFPIGSYDKPRHPSFKGLRNPIDL